ncbi:hypothetical protein [Methylovulum psychrotolerans]|uniref:Uncharacterized protein n=1 Tax=Methylovulum psychrotolerans TaxID=1704499 RepID=A0A2S5CTF3_9GAMM|nr:hypothetical protein [Methylovulum psychrotolerans]POZ54017.1 hypothetical protein AADEFJLK_01060 [Methylovulum psychrotolerans]
MISDNVPYSDYFVAFLDVLGFKELVMSKAPKDKKKISEYFQLIEEVTYGIRRFELKKEIATITISDSVIIAIPMDINDSQNLNNLRQLCIAIQKIQFKLAEKNIWLRGAISSGKAYFNAEKSQVVGPAYINAYLLEERLAINPRVILDNKLISALKFKSAGELINTINNHGLSNSEYNLQERDILFDWTGVGQPIEGLNKDVALFINYLSYAFQDENKLGAIVENIEKSIYTDTQIYPKYKWVVDYLIMLCRHPLITSNINGHLINQYCKRLQNL